MPSSLLFAGLVGTWLVVLVPMAARRRQRMTRPSDAALASRVLARPGRAYPTGGGDGTEEVSGMHGPADPWPRCRPGRGGYDPEAAELAARARYVFRQRVVLGLVLLAMLSAAVAAGLSVPEAWWVQGAADLALVVYLVNLRRQVRLERQIRARRAARMAGRPSAGQPEAEPAAETPGQPAEPPEPPEPPDQSGPDAGQHAGDSAEPPVQHDDWELVPLADVPALPRLQAGRIPPHPAGTERLELDDEDPELYDLGHEELWGYRRAAG